MFTGTRTYRPHAGIEIVQGVQKSNRLISIGFLRSAQWISLNHENIYEPRSEQLDGKMIEERDGPNEGCVRKHRHRA